MDEQAIREAVEKIIVAVGEDPKREGLLDTPRRVTEMYGELFSGMFKDPREDLKVGYELGHRELVLLKDIPFYSMCEHHCCRFTAWYTSATFPTPKGAWWASASWRGWWNACRAVRRYRNAWQHR
jgi:GTP cyclohydrolase I